MKVSFLFLGIIIFLLSSCYKTTETTTEQTIQIPITKTYSEQEAESGLQQGSPTTLTSFGGIYIYKNYLLINERGQGIHIYDNSVPSAPVKQSFMNIPGNYDMAIKDDILYADSFDDLLSLNISNVESIQLIERKNNVFPEQHPRLHPVILGYKDTVILTTSTYTEHSEIFRGEEVDDSPIFLESTSFAQNSNTSGNVGTAGSFTRFCISNDHLFTIDNTSLSVFDISNQQNMTKLKSETFNFNGTVETLFPYQNSLFVGSTDGVFIYDITNPADFNYVSLFTHARACDPVYVENDVAYVTLRSNTNTWCGGQTNQLDILDVSDIENPSLTNTYSMVSPHGVGVDDSLLFVCEANSGLKVYSIQKDYSNNKLTHVNLSSIKHESAIFAYDVIPNNGNLIVVGKEGLWQYDYTDPSNISLLSKIE